MGYLFLYDAYKCNVVVVIKVGACIHAWGRVEPIVLKVLMIMLCCTAQEMCHLRS